MVKKRLNGVKKESAETVTTTKIKLISHGKSFFKVFGYSLKEVTRMLSFAECLLFFSGLDIFFNGM